MRHKVSKITAAGKLVEIYSTLADKYSAYVDDKVTTVKFFQLTKSHWFSDDEYEVIATVVVHGPCVVERA